MTDRRVAVLGLGAMGGPMARRLSGAFELSVFDPLRTAVDALAEVGAQAAVTPAEAADGSEVLVVAVRDQRQLDAALFGPDGAATTLRPGATVVLTSTVGPTVARELAVSLSEFGGSLVDAPVSGGPRRAGNGELLMMVGAEQEIFDRVAGVLGRLASRIEQVGPNPGDGQALKLVNQLLCGVHIAAAAEAVALAEALGLDAVRAVEALQEGAASSFMLGDRGRRMVAAERPEVLSRVDIFVKDLGLVAGHARTTGVPVPVAAAAEQLFTLATRAGLGVEDDSQLVEMLRRDRSGDAADAGTK